MSGWHKGWILIWVMMYAVLHTGIMADALVWAPTSDDLAIRFPNNHFTLQLNSGEQTFLHLPITNWGAVAWNTSEFYIQSILPGTENLSLSPVAPQPLWSSDNKTLSYKATWGKIDLGDNFDFQLPITAPKDTGQYRMYLQPIINEHPLPNLITVDMTIGKLANTVAEVLPPKRIEVSLIQQTVKIFEGPYQLAEFVASTGRKNMETPSGRYIINKKLVKVFSDAPINLWLPYWMELRDLNGVYEGYGIHGVPYKIVNSNNYKEGKRYGASQYYSNGKLYAGYFALGHPISQGCVVTTLSAAEAIYNWAEPNHTIVNIQ